ncbi:MAG: intradiol ring-cleavage dioxygenase [Saprospiraceae bacterium]|nr:intradiol ring-cleavage dioxygenase [Saprospiraceae bacterium]
MKIYAMSLALYSSVLSVACSQPNSPRLVGTCEGCEAIFEYGDRQLTTSDTLSDYHENGTKLKIYGTVYRPDGFTPAADVILYFYHTNSKGIYENKYQRQNWERRHGYIRGWIKTDQSGKYSIYTTVPGSYPNRSEPAHIHVTVLEPDGRYYWLDSFYFAGDPLLNGNELSKSSVRGGAPNIMSLISERDLMVGKRDIILGANVEDYK